MAGEKGGLNSNVVTSVLLNTSYVSIWIALSGTVILYNKCVAPIADQLAPMPSHKLSSFRTRSLADSDLAHGAGGSCPSMALATQSLW